VRALGGESTVFDMSTMAFALEKLISAKRSLRTLVLELGTHRLAERDVATIAELMETDVRFVTRVKADIDLAGLPAGIAPRLSSRVVELPTMRYDELPTTLHDIVAELAPGVTVHATAIERSLLMMRYLDEDRLLETFRVDVRRWVRTTSERDRGLRGEHLFEPEAYPAHWCIHGFEVPRRRG
jgi:hypothetical protein